jgi:hypothetical protein
VIDTGRYAAYSPTSAVTFASPSNPTSTPAAGPAPYPGRGARITSVPGVSRGGAQATSPAGDTAYVPSERPTQAQVVSVPARRVISRISSLTRKQANSPMPN